MMIFYWLASLGEFLPLEHDHIVYAVLLFGLGALGVDRIIEQTRLVRENSWLQYLLG